ncbi:MAG: sulfotransferase [Actinomycetota bacterium]
MPEHDLERPDWARRLNLFGPSVGGAHHLVGLDADEMMETACASTGLADFGDDDGWIAPFRAVVGALDTACELNTLGRLSAREEVLRCLQMRLRMVDLWSREPSVLATDVTAPVFILGPPRTGTSILLELLALDPNLRPVIAHEAHHPLGPLPAADGHSTLELSEPEQEFWADIQPEFITMHELRGDLPCECVHFCAPEFASWHWAMMHDLPELDGIGQGQGMDRVYAWHKRFLQTLQHGDGSPQTFLLKSPAHLGSLTELLAVYPDARMIHTHRDPLKFVGSSANLTATLHWMRRDRLEKAGRGQLMSLAYQLMMGLVMGQRASGEIPAGQMADLHFRDLMTDPVGAIERAYDHLGMVFPDEMRSRVPDYLANKPKGKFGPHVYDPALLGLDEAGLRDEFADYIAHYAIELEG